MGRKILLWSMTGLLAASAVPAAGAPGQVAETRKVHFALTYTCMIGRDLEGEFGGLTGPGARIDVDLGQHFIVSPETVVVLYWETVAPACTLNFRFGLGYVGLGPMITLTDVESWKNHVFLKAHVGVRAGMFLIEAAYIRGRSSSFGGTQVALIGLTLGIVF